MFIVHYGLNKHRFLPTSPALSMKKSKVLPKP